MVHNEELRQGAKNLLINCAELSSSDRLLIILEDPSLGWYEADIATLIISEAERMGIRTKKLIVGAPKNKSNNAVEELINQHDCTIFFARIGDQDRFAKSTLKKKRIMSYARNISNLASSFGSTNYQATLEMKDEINNLFYKSKSIKIECPLGTNLSGKVLINKTVTQNDVSVTRFPIVVPMPINASSFSGEVIISNYLTSTGSKVYQPASLNLRENIVAKISNGRIDKFLGNLTDIKNVNRHYEKVSELFTLDRNVVHSWHAGLHSGISYNFKVEDNPDRWANTIFPSPNYLHFHTCGDYAPGEICWMIKSPIIKIDGIPLWENARVKVENFKSTSKLLLKWPELERIYFN